MKSQNDLILARLKQGRSLTPLQALNQFGCFRLAARVYDLREKGHMIECEMVEVNDSRVARYFLRGVK